jgi:DNA repair protein SbcC/Rad50
MRLHTLELTAFGPYPRTERVDFDELAGHGLFLLTGPTGGGKTTVLDAVCFAIFGAVPGERQAAKRLRSDHAVPDVRTRVALDVTLRGRRLRFVRTPEQERPKLRGSGTTTEKPSAALEEFVDGTWSTLANRPDEIGLSVDALLGMSREQFCQVVLLPQGDFAAFLTASADDRRALLQRLFATERFAAVERWLVDRRLDAHRELGQARSGVDAVVARFAEAADLADVPDFDVDAISAWADEHVDAADKRVRVAVERLTAARSAVTRAKQRQDIADLQQRYA